MGGRFPVLLVATAVTLVAGCSGGDVDTDGPPEQSTVDALDTAVRPAAATLLDTSSLAVTTLWFDGDGERIRTDWLDYRAHDAFVIVTQLLGPADGSVDEMAWIQLADDRFCASSGPNLYCDVDNPKTDEPWALRKAVEVETNATRIPISLDLEAMATRSTAAGLPTENISATRQGTAGGDVLWTLITAADGDTLTQEWTIGSDGSLRSYVTGSATGLPFGLYSRMEFTFVIAMDPAPIGPPQIDTPLDLDTLNLPDDLLRSDG